MRLRELVLGHGDSASSSLLFAQYAGELLFGGLASLMALDVIQGAQLAQHRS